METILYFQSWVMSAGLGSLAVAASIGVRRRVAAHTILFALAAWLGFVCWTTLILQIQGLTEANSIPNGSAQVTFNRSLRSVVSLGGIFSSVLAIAGSIAFGWSIKIQRD